MRILSLAVGTLVALLLAIPAASAHITITATKPTAPIPVGEATSIPTQITVSCVDVVSEYMGETEFELQLKDAPSWVTFKGDTLAVSIDKCGTDGNVKADGKIDITPGQLAPGMQEISLTIIAKGQTAEVKVPVTVQWRGALTIDGPPAPEIMLNESQAVVDLQFNASINAASMIMIEVMKAPEFGTLNLPSSVELASPLADNQTFTLYDFQFAYQATPGANFSMDMVEIQFLMHSADDPSSATAPQSLMFHFMPGEHHEEHDHATHEHPAGGGVPGFDLAFALVAAGGLVLIRRRRA